MAALLSMLRKKEVGLAFLHFPTPSTHKNKNKTKKSLHTKWLMNYGSKYRQHNSKEACQNNLCDSANTFVYVPYTKHLG